MGILAMNTCLSVSSIGIVVFERFVTLFAIARSMWIFDVGFYFQERWCRFFTIPVIRDNIGQKLFIRLSLELPSKSSTKMSLKLSIKMSTKLSLHCPQNCLQNWTQNYSQNYPRIYPKNCPKNRPQLQSGEWSMRDNSTFTTNAGHM